MTWSFDKAKEIRHSSSNAHIWAKLTIVIVYVDDIIVTGDDFEEIERLTKKLAKEFEIKDLGRLKYFLGIEVA